MKKEIFIEPEYVIVNLLDADKKKYLTISRLFQFVSYLRQQLKEMKELSESSEIIFDISFDSIERTVRYNDKVFDLVGETIVVKNDKLPVSPESVAEFLPKIAKEFAELYVA